MTPPMPTSAAASQTETSVAGAKHTPGPWSPGHMTNPELSCQCRYIFSEGYMGSVAVISKSNGIGSIAQGDNDSPPEEEAIANAYLIASAPDLLDALQNLIECHNGFDDTQIQRRTDMHTLLLVRKARAAIAKATGAAA